jgi:myo-inositol-1(or 4)-monophosphatase
MDFIKSTIEANYELYNFLQSNHKNNIFNYTGKIGAGGDNSLVIDLIAEDIFIKYLGQYGNIVSEESGKIVSKNPLYDDLTIIIDPIDGSNNLIANIPYYGTSVAFVKNQKTIGGVICNLANGDIVIKHKIPLKANLNNLDFKPLIVNSSPKVGIFERSYTSSDMVKKFQINDLKFRSLGAMAVSLSLAYSVDFVVGRGSIRKYDVAAGLYICKQLNIYQDDNLLIVSNNMQTFQHLKQTFLS